ncbi:hypothetical protein MRX96_030539 [Rhipicephalus microplus]
MKYNARKEKCLVRCVARNCSARKRTGVCLPWNAEEEEVAVVLGQQLRVEELQERSACAIPDLRRHHNNAADTIGPFSGGPLDPVTAGRAGESEVLARPYFRFLSIEALRGASLLLRRSAAWQALVTEERCARVVALCDAPPPCVDRVLTSATTSRLFLLGQAPVVLGAFCWPSAELQRSTISRGRHIRPPQAACLSVHIRR